MMQKHYIKIQDGRTYLFQTEEKWSEQPTLVAEWNRVLDADELDAIQRDEYMTFLLHKLEG